MNRSATSWCLVALAILVAGCTTANPPNGTTADLSPTAGTTTASTLGTSTGPTATAVGDLEFPSGIYYVDPRHDLPGSPLVRLNLANGTFPRQVRVYPNLYDIESNRVISSDSHSSLRLEDANGGVRTVTLNGLYAMGRPTFAADGTQVAVQAVDDPTMTPSPGVAAPYAIYVANLTDGSHHRVSSTEEKCESPKWIPDTSHLLFSCFQPPGPGMPKLHIVESASGADVRTWPTIGTLMPGISKDGHYFLQPELLRVWDLNDGSLVADLKDQALAGMRAAGYDVDSVHDGVGHRGSFPLDGDFSPDGTQLVFDGAVTKGSDGGILVMQIKLDGTGFRLVTPLIHAEPAETNNYNYSPVNPRWLG